MVLRVNFKSFFLKKSTKIHDILFHFQTNKNPTQPIPVIDLDVQPTATKRKRQNETITLDDTNEQNSVMVVREISEIKIVREKRCKIIQNDDSIGSRVKSCSRMNASRSRLVNPRVRGLGKSNWTTICLYFKDFDFFCFILGVKHVTKFNSKTKRKENRHHRGLRDTIRRAPKRRSVLSGNAHVFNPEAPANIQFTNAPTTQQNVFNFNAKK